GDRVKLELGARPARGLRQKAAHGVPERVAERRVEAEAGRRRRDRKGAIPVPVFGDLDGGRPDEAHGARYVLAQFGSRRPIVRDDSHRVVADSVDPILLDEGRGVVDEELPDVGVRVSKHQAAGPALIGEVEAVVLIAVGRSVVEIEALRVEAAAGMIVDKIEDDGNAMQVREIDQAFQLIDARPKLFEGQRPGAKLGERRVDLPKIAREIGVVAHLVALLGREIVDAVVPFAEFRLEFLDWQELNGGDAEVAEVAETRGDVEKAASPRRARLSAG